MPTIKVGDINIYNEIKGKGEPLLLIMGIGGKAPQWALSWAAPHLAGKTPLYSVVRPRKS